MMRDYRNVAAHQGFRRRWPWQRVRRQIWHRSHLDTHNGEGVSTELGKLIREYDGRNPEDFVAIWGHKEMGTGGKVPYHCLVKQNGDVWWFVPWNRIAPGAAPLNASSYNIAVECDLRRQPMSVEQRWGAYWLARMLGREHGVHEIVGHGAAVGSGKDCPGKLLDFDALRRYTRPLRR